MKAFIGLHALREEALEKAHFELGVRARDGLLGQPQALAMAASAAGAAKKPFRFEIS